MKTLIASIALTGLIAGPALALQPIRGSITYGAQYGQVTKAPAGSVVTNDFYNGGQRYTETYVVGPDQQLELIQRSESNSN
ncbi:hypothetical protein [Martelella radicis]|uniref:Uncharacterized protein n=1 Tax=Martelella radicis TaxID=1397476 RepID=A0A7W6P986_9HYPH|nr:hypothetical protein [Martelella radicis]MBB4120162.1 hypothetical protein [Martelella radicis]